MPTQAAEGREFQGYSVAQGLSAKTVGALAEDRDGNLWIGTFGSGAMKMARSGFTTILGVRWRAFSCVTHGEPVGRSVHLVPGEGLDVPG